MYGGADILSPPFLGYTLIHLGLGVKNRRSYCAVSRGIDTRTTEKASDEFWIKKQ